MDFNYLHARDNVKYLRLISVLSINYLRRIPRTSPRESLLNERANCRYTYLRRAEGDGEEKKQDYLKYILPHFLLLFIDVACQVFDRRMRNIKNFKETFFRLAAYRPDTRIIRFNAYFGTIIKSGIMNNRRQLTK